MWQNSSNLHYTWVLTHFAMSEGTIPTLCQSHLPSIQIKANVNPKILTFWNEHLRPWLNYDEHLSTSHNQLNGQKHIFINTWFFIFCILIKRNSIALWAQFIDFHCTNVILEISRFLSEMSKKVPFYSIWGISHLGKKWKCPCKNHFLVLWGLIWKSHSFLASWIA